MQRLRAMGKMRIAAGRGLRRQGGAVGAGRLEIAAPSQGTKPHHWSDVTQDSQTPTRPRAVFAGETIPYNARMTAAPVYIARGSGRSKELRDAGARLPIDDDGNDAVRQHFESFAAQQDR